MAKFDIHELNYITCGKKQNTFNITYCYTDDGHIASDMASRPTLSTLHTTTLFGDIGEYQTMSQRYNSNKCSFYDMTNKMIVHNLYDKSKALLKTTAKKQSSGLQKRQNIDMFMPLLSSDFINICQFDNYAYGLTEMTDQSPICKNVSMNDHGSFDTSYHYALSNRQIETFLCPKPDEVSAGTSAMSYDSLVQESGELSNSVISSIFDVKRAMEGIKYNYILEIPEDTMQNEYYDGFIQCDMAIAKNHLDTSYTMDMTSSFSLDNCREYCNIGVCGSQMYLTYRDNVNYTCTSQTSASNGISALSMEMSKKPYGYQHVEVAYSWNKFDRQAASGHKSSMFSLKLIDTGLNESSINQQAKEKLRQNIQKNVRAMIESVTPANCQLFEIYFDGK